MSKDGRIWLSHTGIETYFRCPRCFWLLYKKGIRQPEGIVSRLANRFDEVMKKYFNTFRIAGTMPDLVKGKLEGKLENPFKEKYFVTVNEKFGFWGKLDECLISGNGEYIPVDFKTASTDPRKKEILSAYQSQIDDYLFLIKNNGKKPADHGYLVYVYPDEGTLLHTGFPMVIHVVKLNGNPEKTAERIKTVMGVLEKPIPEPHEKCPFCSWYKLIKNETEKNVVFPVLSTKKPLPKIKKSASKTQGQTSLMDMAVS